MSRTIEEQEKIVSGVGTGSVLVKNEQGGLGAEFLESAAAEHPEIVEHIHQLAGKRPEKETEAKLLMKVDEQREVG